VQGPRGPCRDDEPLRGYGCPHSHPPLLEVHRAWAGAFVDDDVGLDRDVGHREQGDAAVGQSPALGQAGGHLAERKALSKPQRPGDVCAEVFVAQGRTSRVARRARPTRPARHTVSSARPHPWPSWTAPPEGVEHGVEIGAHPQPEEGDVVARVPDDGHGGVGQSDGVRSMWASSPRRNRAPPTPPDKAVTRMVAVCQPVSRVADPSDTRMPRASVRSRSRR
jgi:hypothetical protein